MNRRHSFASACAILACDFAVVLPAAAAGDAEVDIRQFAVPGHASLQLKVPKAWKDSLKQPPNNLPPTIKLQPATGDEFDVLITVMWDFTGKGDLKNVEKLRADVEKRGQELLPGAQEKTLKVEELKCDAGTAAYFTLTDKDTSSEKGYPYMTHGTAAIGDLFLTFTLLHRTKGSPDTKAVLEMLKTAVHKPAEKKDGA